ncbi:MAG: hypothetical protein J6T10_22670 [Methanobrevibacter sp.]|nr:hypothetical protein [Methanobrevibacter sp.]
MVVIVKGKVEKKVTYYAYNNFFKTNGWVLKGEGKTSPEVPYSEVKKEVVEKPKNDAKKEIPSTEQKNVGVESEPVNNEDSISDEDWDEVLDEMKDDEVEKPLSEMSKKELIAKANSLNIKVPNGYSNQQIRELIKTSR